MLLFKYGENESGLLGQMLDLHPGDSNYTFGELTLPFQDNSPPGCPRIHNDVVLPTNGGGSTDVTLSIPNFTVTSAVPDASGSNGETAFAWRPQLHFDLEVIIWDGNVTFGGYCSPTVTQMYDNPKLQHRRLLRTVAAAEERGGHPYRRGRQWSIAAGTGGPQILCVGNQDRLLDGIQSVYRRYMAQVATAKMRVPASAASAQEKYTATWENSNRRVLRQSNGSKLALQVLLGVTFACGVAAYLLVETSEVLPHDPCSIAGLASLLTGSSMCSEELAAAEEDGGGSDQDAAWGSQLFSLGWSESSVWEGGRFGIDVGEARWMGREAQA
ncbi:hypothetical protein diail_10872 [Diaporthe ilicicola]|nr:hypothetical protein diail_10872 [Diaporthe ilicicola]